MLKLKLQYFGYLMGRASSLKKTQIVGKIEGKRKRGLQRMRWLGQHHQLNVLESEQTLGGKEGQESLVCCSPLGGRVRHNLATELNSTVRTY